MGWLQQEGGKVTTTLMAGLGGLASGHEEYGTMSDVDTQIPNTAVSCKPRRLLISFSGGETSAEMAVRLLEQSHFYDEIAIVFANTSRENHETLVFVDKCDRLLFQPLGHRVAWIEAVQHHGKRKGAGFRLTSFAEACEDGSVFEEMIRKYGIPNQKYLHCTRELKLNPILNYALSLGWEKGGYDTAIGIRADEIDRMSSQAAKNRIIYPLVKAGVRKVDVNKAWRDRPFRLNGKGYQFNCEFCHKKSFRKLFTQIAERPQIFDFSRRMETLYGEVGGEFSKAAGEGQEPLGEGYRRVFYRGNMSTDSLFAMYEQQKESFIPAEDDSQKYPDPDLFDDFLDTPGGCGETCEVWADADLEEYNDSI